MANQLYPKFKESILQAGINLSSGDVKIVLIDSADYTFSTAHQFLSDIPSGAREEISAALGSKTFTNGVFDAADTSWPSATGDPCEAAALFVDTGNAATSPLICYWDSATGLPVTLSGVTVNCTWDNGANKIFAL